MSGTTDSSTYTSVILYAVKGLLRYAHTYNKALVVNCVTVHQEPPQLILAIVLNLLFELAISFTKVLLYQLSCFRIIVQVFEE